MKRQKITKFISLVDHKTLTILFLVGFLLLFKTVAEVEAENMQSDSYKIQFGNFNVTAGEKSGPTYKVTDTVGQTGAGPYGTYGVSNYFVGGGFQYIYQIPEFEFSLSATNIDLGELIIGSHSSADHDMSITTRGAGGYTVYVIAQSPFTHQSGSTTIPFTSCDLGDCTITSATSWIQQSIPGFGYNMSGTNVPTDFSSSAMFRPFPDATQAQSPAVIMSSTEIANNDTATITYKAGIDATQAAGRYNTAVSFIAVPGY